MSGLIFEDLSPAAPAAPNRADVAAFVGFVARRLGAGSTRVVPPVGATRVAADFPLFAWLDSYGWTRRPYLPDAQGYTFYGPATQRAPEPPPWTRDDDQIESLLDVPVPIESWEVFDRLFAWDQRPLVTATDSDDDSQIPIANTYLGAAVRSFFAQGGRRCYVIRVGDPWPFDAPQAVRRRALGLLLPGFPNLLTVARADRASWSGAGHLFGLPDVSFLSFPDLPDAVAGDLAPPKPAPAPPPSEEVFVECSLDEPAPVVDRFVRGFAAPRAREDGFGDWAAALQTARNLLELPANGLREIQLVAAVPLPAVPLPPHRSGDAPPDVDLLAWLAPWIAGPPGDDDALAPGVFASAFVQLAWPWVKSPGSRDLPEELEAPDGVLVGLLARNALVRGTFRCAAGLPLAEIQSVYPPLRGQDRELTDVGSTLIERVSLLGPTAAGMQLLSDVTTFPAESYRQGNVNRLVSAIVRAARRLGESVTFAPSGPRLWAHIRGSLGGLLTQLWRDGALGGKTAAEAFDVRCDMSLMNDRDLEAGRVLVEVSFVAAAAIEQIRVVLALSEGAASLVKAA